MNFQLIPKGTRAPSIGINKAYLKIDNWNDYSFVTLFGLSLHDHEGTYHDIGPVKIALKGQTTAVDTYATLPLSFSALDDTYFSLGNNEEFYQRLHHLPDDLGTDILLALRDVVLTPGLLEKVRDEEVFGKSLLRDVSISTIKGQFSRILAGQTPLTDFKFRFKRPETEDMGALKIDFDVVVESKPSSNIHAIIGRNGAGKTTLLNNMIDAITAPEKTGCVFVDNSFWVPLDRKISEDYFSSLISVSFSAFDPFEPPLQQADPSKGTCYFYIGLKNPNEPGLLRSITELRAECVTDLHRCFIDPSRAERWRRAIEKLGSDENFQAMDLGRLWDAFYALERSPIHITPEEFFANYSKAVDPILANMSSGHAVVLFTMTSLVANVSEKTLVLLDEPESHLHPPLLSAFLRALSDLLSDRNGVAIIATHSPVVLQEIPRSCVSKIFRSGKTVSVKRPDIETFAENVGVLTAEVFSLEVEKSGFMDLLAKSVADDKTYEEILEDYSNQLGLEGRAILSSMVANHTKAKKE